MKIERPIASKRIAGDRPFNRVMAIGMENCVWAINQSCDDSAVIQREAEASRQRENCEKGRGGALYDRSERDRWRSHVKVEPGPGRKYDLRQVDSASGDIKDRVILHEH